MKLTAHNLVGASSGDVIRFVVWSKKGTGMVNVFSAGCSGDIMSIEGARKYWKDMIEKFGYRKSEDSTVEPY